MTTKPLADLLLATAWDDPGRPFAWHEGRVQTYGEAAGAALGVAGGLERMGVGPGDRVAVLLGNRPELLSAWFGASLAGATFVPVEPGIGSDGLAWQLAHCKARVLLADAASLPAALAVRARLPLLEAVVALDHAPQGTVPFEAFDPAGPRRPTSPAADEVMEIIYTPGTSRRPRGVVWRHGMLPAMAAAVGRLLELDRHDRLLVVAPLAHASAQLQVAMALAAGASLQLTAGLAPERFWDAARDGQATQATLPGPFVAALHAQPPRADDLRNPLRLVLTAATPPFLLEEFEGRFGLSLVEAYGLTETGLNALSPPERGRRKLGTVGLAAPYNDVAILGPDLRPVALGQPGEICVRPARELAPLWIPEYLDDPQATAALRRGGWLHTGDVGVVDDEGFLTYVDRMDDVISRDGAAISSRELEQVLLRHPAVSEAAVVARPRPGGEPDVLAVLVLRAPAEPAAIAAFCRAWLGPDRAPTLFKLVEGLPKTPSGRIRKSELRLRPDLFADVRDVKEIAA